MLGGVAGHVAGPGVGVLDVVDGVVGGGGGQQIQVDVDHGVHGGAGQGVAGRVHADGVDQVLQGDDGAGALGHAHRDAVAHEVDELSDEDLHVGAGSVPEGRAHGHHPADVAVVVGPEQVDGAVGAALALVQVVGEVGGEVGGVAVRLDEDAVLVVPEVGGAQPGGAVALLDDAALAQAGDGALDGAGGVQGVLVEEDVEVGAEGVQLGLDGGEHEVDAAGAEDFGGLGVGQGGRVGAAGGELVGGHLLGDLADVGTTVAVLGGLLAACGGQQGAGEAVDLGAVVVEVVLPGDLSATGGQDSGQGVADGGPAGATQVDRPGGVGRDVLEVDVLAAQGVVAAVGLTGLDDGAGELAGAGGVEADVEEAGAGDLHGGDAVEGLETRNEELGEVARLGAGLLGQLHGHVGGPVTVVAVAGALDAGVGNLCGGQGEGALGGGLLQDGADGCGKLFWGHARQRTVNGRAGSRASPAAAGHRGTCRMSRAGFTPGPGRWYSHASGPGSSVDRASASGAEGRRFESCPGHHSRALVATRDGGLLIRVTAQFPWPRRSPSEFREAILQLQALDGPLS